MAASLLSYISHYGREEELIGSFKSSPDAWPYEPTRATAIVACVPAYVDASGQSATAGSGQMHGEVLVRVRSRRTGFIPWVPNGPRLFLPRILNSTLAV